MYIREYSLRYTLEHLTYSQLTIFDMIALILTNEHTCSQELDLKYINGRAYAPFIGTQDQLIELIKISLESC